MSDAELCHCGKPLHYTVPAIEASMRKVVAEAGPFLLVVVGSKMYRVPRHFIALHGVKANVMDSYGFEVVEP